MSPGSALKLFCANCLTIRYVEQILFGTLSRSKEFKSELESEL